MIEDNNPNQELLQDYADPAQQLTMNLAEGNLQETAHIKELLAELKDWDPNSKESLLLQEDEITTFIVCKNKVLIVYCYDTTIVVYRSPEESARIFNDSPIKCIASNSDDSLLFAGNESCEIVVWDVDSILNNLGSEVQSTNVIKGHSGYVTYLYAEHEDFLISSSEDNTIKLWSKENNYALEHTFDDNGSPFRFSLSYVKVKSDTIVSGTSDCSILVFSIEERKMIRCYEEHKEEISCLDVSKEGDKIVSGSYSHEVRIWNTKRSTSECVLQGHRGTIVGVAFSKDCKCSPN